MARITTHRGSVSATLNYYLSDYYEAGPKFEMQWLGDGAQRLGLEGTVESRQFERLLQNRHPLDDTKLSPRNRDNRRKGWDVNFNTPKSVGVVFALNNDFDIVDALRHSVHETLQEMEQDVMTRVNLASGQLHEKTRNLIAAVVIHPDARAVPGSVPDMNLHAHAFVSNHTFAEKRWTAADISHLYRDAQGYYEATFQSRLATKLQDLGYRVERSRHNFEIAGVSRDLIDKFSKRSQQINELIQDGYAEKLATRKGVSLADAKDMIGALSRKAKDQSWTFDELQTHWHMQLTPSESRQLDAIEQDKHAASITKSERVSAKQAVDFALEHGFEKEAVLRDRHILRDAVLYSIGDVTVADIKQELARRELIRDGAEEAAISTTRGLQQEERSILEFAIRGRGSVAPLAPEHQIQRAWLSREQQHAVTALLQSTDRLQILRGAAGVGKTTSMQEAIEAIEQTGKPIAVMAPGTKAAYDVLRDQDGFDATTVAAFLLDRDRQKAVRNGVIWVDEAGLIGNPTMQALLNVAREQDARVILGGDAHQHSPIERGHPLKLLAQHAGIRPKEITEIRRQTGDYKQAVEHLSRGEIQPAFEMLDAIGSIHEIPGQRRNEALADAYLDALKRHDVKELLIIAPTHAERRQITHAIRDRLRDEGYLRGKDRELTTYVSKQLSTAERKDAMHYSPGDLVAFHGFGSKRIRPGTQLTVDHVEHGKIFNNEFGEIPLSSAGSFQVYRPETAPYAPGDLIRLSRGRRQEHGQRKLTNGSLHRIKSIHRDVITLENGQKLGAEFRFFDHGFAVTSHVSQGSTVHRAFVAQSSLSFAASSPEQLYVSASRAKQRVDIFTDSKAGLLAAVSRHRPKTLATDVEPVRPTPASRLRNFGSTWNRAKQVAQQFATRQWKRFHDWWPAVTQRPRMAR